MSAARTDPKASDSERENVPIRDFPCRATHEWRPSRDPCEGEIAGKARGRVIRRATGFFGGPDPMEDLNYLVHRRKEERDRAKAASCPKAREAHETLAEFYENRIRDLTAGR